MIQYIIAAGIGAFLGSQSKKSKKTYAHGGEVSRSDMEEWFYEHDNEWQNDIDIDHQQEDTNLDLVEWSYNRYHYAKGGRVYEISDIEYDTDDDSDLPKTLKIEVPSGYEGYEADEFISDKISDETGFTHLGYSTNPEIKYAKGGKIEPTHAEIIEWLEQHPELDGYNEDGTPTDETYQDAIDEIKAERGYAEGGVTDEYVAITLKPKKSAYRGGKGEVYKSMQNFYDTISSTDNKDKYEFIHSIFISDSRKSDPKDISEIKVYMIGEKSGFDDVEKRGLYDFFDLVKTKEEVKDYAKGGKTYNTFDEIKEEYGRYYAADFYSDYVMDRIDSDERRKIREDWNDMYKGGTSYNYEKMGWQDYLLKRVNEKNKK